ncbi:hypothetical protein L873DRAFT_1816597 [Choiromyces venosus 120613-1]|uniref:Uncharacterized protein n=1 Tax=Choiromyces venosus 120613-1 TaxID=1336337 RepID=A0A3N4JGS0_9PEZI|nr:hypothetical protein L873DRAFT_1816597 [Choiromyces venosus 120613-1]
MTVVSLQLIRGVNSIAVTVYDNRLFTTDIVYNNRFYCHYSFTIINCHGLYFVAFVGIRTRISSIIVEDREASVLLTDL